MRDYGIVSPRFWIGETGRKLRSMPYAQRVAMYLLSAPASEMTGVYYCPVATILNDVGLPSESLARDHEGALKAVIEALKTLRSLDFCEFDFDSEYVFVKEMARWQIAEKLKPTDNRVKGIIKTVESMPEPIRARFIARYNDDFSLGFEVGKQQKSEAPSKPLQSQEQEQEQEQEQDKKVVVAPKAKREPTLSFPDSLPAEWRQAALQIRSDVTPERVFLKLRSRYAPTTAKKTVGNWRKIFLGWIGREYPETGKTSGKAPLLPHKDPAFHFGKEYYDKSVNPDGTTNWGV